MNQNYRVVFKSFELFNGNMVEVQRSTKWMNIMDAIEEAGNYKKSYIEQRECYDDIR